MALIYDAELSPSKSEMLQDWIPEQRWISDASDLRILGTYRFDDPAGDVGIETFLLTSADRVLQVPVTYRREPLAGGEEFLICTMDHSVLGRRWVYDAVADPVYASMLSETILTGGRQADLHFAYPAPPEHREVTTRVTGSGNSEEKVSAVDSVAISQTGTVTTIDAGPLRLDVCRVIDTSRTTTEEPYLAGTWPGQSTPAVLALVSGT